MPALERWAVIAKLLTALVAASSLASTIATLVYLEVEYTWLDETIGDELVYDLITYAGLALLLISFIAVAMWLVQAHGNLRAANIASLRFTPGWVLAWYFIPFANLFMPLLAMKELWQGSHREPINRMATANALLWIWWLAWIATNLNAFGDDLTHLDTVSSAANTVSAAALFVIITRITAAQPSMRIETEFE